MNGMAEEIRVQFGEMDRKRDEGLTTPSDILRFNDISYGSDFVWNKLDVYYKRELPKIFLSLSAYMEAAGFTGIRMSTSITPCTWRRWDLP